MIDRMSYKIKSFDSSRFLAKHKLVPAMEAFVIANSTLFFGMFVYQLIDPSIIPILVSFGLDISIISIGIIWGLILTNSIGLGLLVFGWIIAGIYIKKQYGDQTSSIMLRAAGIPVAFILLTVGLFLFSLLLSVPLGLFIFSTVLIFIFILYVFSVIIATGGIIVSQFVAFNDRYDSIYSVEPDYLVLPTIPENEKVKYCPFRSKEPGCSYLGYQASDAPLICDYRSSYLRCRVYSHIYKQLEENSNE